MQTLEQNGLMHSLPIDSIEINGNIGTNWVKAFVPRSNKNAIEYWKALNKWGSCHEMD